MIIYPKALVRRTVGRGRYNLALNAGSEFTELKDPEEVSRLQLRALNNAWRRARTIPFYAEFARIHSLPSTIESLDLLDEWPLLTKDILREHQGLVDATPGVTGHYFTSGSTGVPFAFPHGDQEFSARYASLWSYRVAHGLKPFDPFLHVANTVSGAGASRLQQYRTRAERVVRDVLGNSWKTNGFIGDPELADSAINAISLLRPKYLAGYASGITMIARRAMELGLEFPFLTHVIPTSESVPDHDFRLMREGLNVKIVIEYGSVETGVLAGSSPGADGWPLTTTWRSNLLRADRRSPSTVSTLSDRVFPLINYDLGDAITEKKVGPGGSIIEIDSILGRVSDFVDIPLKNGGHERVSARELGALVRDNSDVRSTQLSVSSEGFVDILIVCASDDLSSTSHTLSSAILRNRPQSDLSKVRLRYLRSPIPGSRGKLGLMVPSERVPTDSPVFPIVSAGSV